MIAYARSKGYNLRHILIAGAGNLGREIAIKAHTYTELGLNVIGFVDDDPRKFGKEIEETPVLGTLDDIQQLIREKGVQQLFIALPMTAHNRTLEILSSLDQECVDVKFIPDLTDALLTEDGDAILTEDGIEVIFAESE